MTDGAATIFPEVPDSASHVRLGGRLRWLAVAVGVTVLATLWFAWGSSREPGYISDFDQLWVAAHSAADGRDPYAESITRPAAPGFPVAMGLYYPMTAVVIVSPLAMVPLRTARLLWVAIGVCSFTLLILARYSYARLPAVMSGAFLMAVSLAQWSPYLACAVMTPAFAWVLSGKPNVGIAAAAASRITRLAILLGAIPLVVAFAWRPDWVMAWRASLHSAEHFHPLILRPGGLLIVLALLKWRRPEARWLIALACLPGTPGAAEALVLFAFPMTFRQCLSLALLTHVPNFLMLRAHFDTFQAFTDRGAILMLAFVYLPALVAILMRPNAGPLPAWLERLTPGLPGWLRGSPV